MNKPIIFISHITEEKEFAEALKALIKRSYLSAVDVFVSSDSSSIEAGSRWLNEIAESLQGCIVELVLCSEQSIKRPWINFEAGAGWIRKIPTIPVCHSGMDTNKLPTPLNSLQSVVISNKEGINGIFAAISKRINMDIPNPDLDSFVTKIKHIEMAYVVGDDMRKFLDSIGGCEAAIEELKKVSGIDVVIGLGRVPNEVYDNIIKHITPAIKKYVAVEAFAPGISFAHNGAARNDVEVKVTIKNREEVIRLCEDSLN